MQENKDFNKQIFDAIKLEAINYFNEIKKHFAPGTYHAKDLTKLIALRANELKYTEVTRKYIGNQKAKQKKLFFVRSNQIDNRTSEATFYNSGKQINIEIDTFKLTFDACKVFDYLYKFSSVNKIKDSLLFTNQATFKKDPIITFDIDIQKDATELSKCVYSGIERPIFNNIFISLEYFTLVASDGYILSEKPAYITNLKGNGTPKNLYISSEVIKNCVGPCKVYYFGNETIIENCKGEQYINSINDNYENYKRVIPEVLNCPIIPIDYSQIKKFLTTAKKNKSIHKFIMKGNEGETKITLFVGENYGIDETINNREIEIDIKDKLQMSFCIAYNIDKFLNIGSFEKMYLKNNKTASIFDLKTGYVLLMPSFLESDGYMRANCELLEHPFFTSEYLNINNTIDTTTEIVNLPILNETQITNSVDQNKTNNVLYDADFDFFMEHQIFTGKILNSNEITFNSRLENKCFKKVSAIHGLSHDEIIEQCKKIHANLEYYNNDEITDICTTTEMQATETAQNIKNEVLDTRIDQLQINTYIEQFLILFLLSCYIQNETMKKDGITKKNNTFDFVEYLAIVKHCNKIAIYNARSG